MLSDNDKKLYEKNNMVLPSVDEHGEDSWENPASSRLLKENPNNWRMEGNLLIADTPNGRLVQILPTNIILKGTDKKGLPIFGKIE